MLRVELPALIGRLNSVARQGLEQAAVLCAQQQAPEVTVGHVLQAMLDQPLCDVRCICESVDLDTAALRAQLAEDTRPPRDLDVTTPSFSPLLVELLQDAWLLASTEYQHQSLRSGAIFTALLHNPERYLGPARFACWPTSIARTCVATSTASRRIPPKRHRKRRQALRGLLRPIKAMTARWHALPHRLPSRRVRGSWTQCWGVTRKSTRCSISWAADAKTTQS